MLQNVQLCDPCVGVEGSYNCARVLALGETSPIAQDSVTDEYIGLSGCQLHQFLYVRLLCGVLRACAVVGVCCSVG
jgi:hypothetical protein